MHVDTKEHRSESLRSHFYLYSLEFQYTKRNKNDRPSDPRYSILSFLLPLPFRKRNTIFLFFEILVKNLNFVAGTTRRFVSAKRLIRYFSNSSKLVEHRAQSPVREVKMLAVWPSITEGFPTAKFTSYIQ